MHSYLHWLNQFQWSRNIKTHHVPNYSTHHFLTESHYIFKHSKPHLKYFYILDNINRKFVNFPSLSFPYNWNERILKSSHFIPNSINNPAKETSRLFEVIASNIIMILKLTMVFSKEFPSVPILTYSQFLLIP